MVFKKNRVDVSRAEIVGHVTHLKLRLADGAICRKSKITLQPWTNLVITDYRKVHLLSCWKMALFLKKEKVIVFEEKFQVFFSFGSLIQKVHQRPSVLSFPWRDDKLPLKKRDVFPIEEKRWQTPMTKNLLKKTPIE